VQQDDTARQTLQPILSSVNPDLRPFKKHRGKMIQYAGWADTAIAPENGLNYYRKVTQTIGDPHGFYRIFLVPGMAHCSGGAGPNAFGNGTSNGPVIDADHDLVKALERWVEQGIAPDQFIATHYVNNVPAQGVQFQRPLCPYPERGEYVGKGRLQRRRELPMRRASRRLRSAQHRTSARLHRGKLGRRPGGACVGASRGSLFCRRESVVTVLQEDSESIPFSNGILPFPPG
jgi:hypothetical protein